MSVERQEILNGSTNSSFSSSLGLPLFKYKDTVMPGEREEDFRQPPTPLSQEAASYTNREQSLHTSTQMAPSRIPGSNEQTNNPRMPPRFSENNHAPGDVVNDVTKDTTWWQTERAMTLYGNLDNDVSESLLPAKKSLADEEKFGVGEEDEIGNYESWVEFRQSHKCSTSIPHSVSSKSSNFSILEANSQKT